MAPRLRCSAAPSAAPTEIACQKAPLGRCSSATVMEKTSSAVPSLTYRWGTSVLAIAEQPSGIIQVGGAFNDRAPPGAVSRVNGNA